MKQTIILITLLMLFATSAFAQIPQTMSYQGVLTDAAGNPVAGPVELTFKLYDAATDGTLLWQETQQVDVANGLFNVILGSSNPLNLAFDKPYWLGSTIGTDAELQPRTALTASPYSLNAQTAGGTGDGHSLDAADGDPTDVVFVDNDGKVGIGTDKPEAALAIVDGVFGTDPLFMVSTGEATSMVITNTGKVGIGTMQPEGLLEINLTRSNNTAAGITTGGSSTVQFFEPILRVGLNGEPLFEVSAERKVLLAEDMSLGIGTVEPTEALDVVGNIKASGKVFASAYSSNSPFIMEAPAGTERARIDDITGNFGIGTPTPAERLDVAGTAQMTGFKLPTGAMSGYVLTSDASGMGTWQPGSGGADNDWTLSGNDMYSAVSGNVGIGTTTPDARLDVIGIAQPGGGGGPPGLGVRNDFGIGVFAQSISDFAAWFTGPKIDSRGAQVEGTVRISTEGASVFLDGLGGIDQFSQGLFLNSNSSRDVILATGGGKVGIGTTTPVAKLEVFASNQTAAVVVTNVTGSGLVGNSSSGTAVFGGSGSSFGGHFIGADNDGTKAAVKIGSGSQVMLLDGNEIDAVVDKSLFLNNNSSGDVVLVRGGGNVIVSTTLVHSSDRRLKKNITTLDHALDKVLNLRGVTFEWKKDGARNSNPQPGVQIGFVAQEVETVVPELVKTDSEGYKSVAYANVTALLIEAVKEQQKTIAEQNAQLKELRSRVNKLERLFSQTAMLNK